MKTRFRSGIVLMLLIVGTIAVSAQDNVGMKTDTARMHRGMYMHHGMQGMRPQMMERGMPGMRGRMGNMQGWGNGFDQRQGMRGGWGNMPGMRGMGRPGMGMGPGFQGMMHQRMLFENIPNLTDKQKKDIAVLRIDQQTEMKKVRDEMQAKMKTMREAHRTALEKILTPDQKKWLDENSPKPSDDSKTTMAPAKTK